jgi:hypothetical protein
MKSKQEPLTLIEAEREFQKVARAFDAYVAKTKHLGKVAILLAEFGDTGYIRTQDVELPWVPLLYGAVNLMDRDGRSAEDIKETFDDFIKMVVMKQAAGHVSAEIMEPCDIFETVLGVFVTEMLGVFDKMGPMGDGRTLVERVGSREALKRKLAGYWRSAIMQIIAESGPAESAPAAGNVVRQ